MSHPQSYSDPFAEEEVVTTEANQATHFHLRGGPGSPLVTANWSDSPSDTSPALFEAPFHIQPTDEPSFRPLIIQEPTRLSTTTSLPPLATSTPSSEFDEFGLPKPPAASTSSAPQSQNTTPAKPQKDVSPRIPVGGVPLGVDSLLKAVKAKDVESVRSLLAQGMNPNAQNEENQTALHLAVLAQSPVIVQLLLACPALDPNMVDIAYNTPIHIASIHVDAPVRCTPDLSELVPAPQPNQPASSSSTNSNSSGQAISPTMLIPASAVAGYSGADDTPLEAIIRLLCQDERTDVNIRNASLHVPLIYSCLSGNYKVSALLVKAGASVNAATHTDIYPLHAACENGYADIVRLLLLNGALVNVRDYQGFTPLHLAARGNFGAICGLLWRHRADINALTVVTPSNPVSKRPSDMATDMEIKNFLSGMKTSSSHPLEVNFVTHSVLGKSRIGMTMCPGRNKKDHRRNLQMDIASLLQVGTQVLVTLVQQHELDSMKISDMMTKVRAAGIEVIHAPIKDKWIPSRIGILVELVDLIVARVKLGKCITVHCNGGKGRTGLVVAATLVSLGMEPGPSTDLIRAVRPGMLYNPAQIVYLRLYQRTISGRAGPGPITAIPTELAVLEAEMQNIPLNDGSTECADTCSSPPEPSSPASSSGAATSSQDATPVILSPTAPRRSSISEIQDAANAQEKSEQPDLPSGQQKPFSIGTLIDEIDN